MHTINFKSMSGNITAKIEINDDIDKDSAESCVKAMMHNLSVHVGSYKAQPIFDEITRLRGEYLENVLKLMTEVAHASGTPVPPQVTERLTGGLKFEWDPNEDEEED